MSSLTWYNKWRPTTFATVSGQHHVTDTVRNAVKSGRIAHAYLFAGPRGTGKTSTARILARAANCEHPQDGEPCNTCRACRRSLDNTEPDVTEIDAASNRGIDDVRTLKDKIEYLPTGSRYHTYIIDEVHQFTTAAFDALLKTLEEPPSHAILILATTELDKIPATIQSRCQVFRFTRLRESDIAERLLAICQSEHVTIPEAGAWLLAQQASGSLRDAINLLEQAVASIGSVIHLNELERMLQTAGRQYAKRLVQAALARSLGDVLRLLTEAYYAGIQPKALVNEMLSRTRLLFYCRMNVDELIELSRDEAEAIVHEARQYPVSVLVQLLEVLAGVDVRSTTAPMLPLEIALAQFVLEPKETIAAPKTADESSEYVELI